MKPFVHENFLLTGETARRLYHEFAAPQPIIDYHCHLPPDQIAANREFKNLYEIWLEGDHYKWRAMRSNGVAERFCTGDASAREKFDAYAATIPYCLRNPLYHWTHLELQRVFGIDELLGPDTADAVWHAANAKLPALRVHDIFRKFNVAVTCTTDDPADSLVHHEAIRGLNESGVLKTRVYPTFRPDKAMDIHQPEAFNEWLDRLGRAARMEIRTLDDLLAALKIRHDDFHAAGCRLSDHGLEACRSDDFTRDEVANAFATARAGGQVTPGQHAAFASFLMLEFGRWDAGKGWTKQMHLGAMRNNNSRMLRQAGRDAGFDSIGDYPQGQALSRYLDRLDSEDRLPKIILYNLNPADNYLFATMLGNFQGGGIPGKIQFGSGWWFLDQEESMIWQLNALSNLGLLRRFVGMLTDSRSFLSYPRHEYFRRILCQLLAGDMERGAMPNDLPMVGAMVREICFENARDHFGFELHPDYRKA
jgi:glucuronate isomerase